MIDTLGPDRGSFGTEGEGRRGVIRRGSSTYAPGTRRAFSRAVFSVLSRPMSPAVCNDSQLAMHHSNTVETMEGPESLDVLEGTPVAYKGSNMEDGG